MAVPQVNLWQSNEVGCKVAHMAATSQAASRLLKYMRERKFVRFSRRFEDGFVRGYVLDVGPKFFLMAVAGDQIRFDGFSCFRGTDVRDLKLDPYAAFSEAALTKLRVPMPKKPRVTVATVEELLISANRQFPLVTIHREKVRPDVCWIGKVQHIHDGHVWLLEIGPGAKWDKKPVAHKLSEITQVEFGGEYERALHLVGGEPPRR